MYNLIKKIGFLTLFFVAGRAQAQTVELTPLYNTIGVKVTGIGAADSCVVEYRVVSSATWRLGYNPDKIAINSVDQFRGSIFMLDENTAHEVRVTLFTGGAGNVLPISQTMTLNSPVFAPTANVKWVSPTGSGTAYTEASPGDITTLFNSGQVTCGTTVLFKDGVYTSNGFAISLNSSCTELTPIVLMAAPGAAPIFDGSTIITTPWTPHPSDPDLYSTPTPVGTSHSNICLLGSAVLYPYPELNPGLSPYSLDALNFGHDGFVRDESIIWIKTQAGVNPTDSVVRVSKAYRFLTIYGGNNAAHLKVKGIEFRYFGRPVLNPFGSPIDSYSATVFDFRNVHHISIDSCRFVYNTNHISFSDPCTNFTIQHSFFKHEAGKWTHAMIKKSNDYLLLPSSARARSVETPAIFMDETKNGVVRNNVFDGVNSGVESYFDTGFNEEIDIYNNTFMDNFDGVECDGLWSNLRVWNNEFIRPMAGISAAPPLIGPRYFYRNVFHGMQGRRNESDDPFFIACEPVVSNYMGQGIGIKTNSGYAGSGIPGNLYFFNNTFHSSDTLGFAFTSWEAEWREATFINNTYTHAVSHPFFYFDLANTPVNGNFQLTSNYENYYSYNPMSPIAVVKEIHGQYDCNDIFLASNLQDSLSLISQSSNVLVGNTVQVDPMFISTTSGGFELTNASPLIDSGIEIQGFYDYIGIRPDIGAKENAFVGVEQIGLTSAEVLVYPNPTSGFVSVLIQSSTSSIELVLMNSFGQRIHEAQVTNGLPLEIDMNGRPNGIYFIELQTEQGKVVKKVIKVGS